MKCKILHESSKRLRVHFYQYHMTFDEADTLEYYIRALEGVAKVTVDERTCNAVIFFESGSKNAIIDALAHFHYETALVELPEHSSRALRAEYEDKVFFLVLRRCITRFVLPNPISGVVTAIQAVRYVAKGIQCLMRGRLEVPVLDATTITVSCLRGDFQTAGTVMFLLGIGDLMEEWTRKKSVDDLAERMYLNVDKVWMKAGGEEILVPTTSVEEGDHIVVRTGNVIPLDGVVVSGEANVNQSSMTGESLPVFKREGGTVFAGTVVDDGECEIRVTRAMGSGRYDRIVDMIEDSQKLKSDTESWAYHLADSLVPWCLGGTALTYFITRNVTNALAILMVDFSCALKLSMPITVMSAMRECSDHHIDVKGGKFLEAVSQARTIVFDKTGTLTYAQPRVAKIYTFAGKDETEVLRLAACLEEHFPHSMANAVVEEARRRGIVHAEKHAKVEYIVAHGIASSIDDERVCIGSYHFIFEDEHCHVPDEDRKIFDSIPAEYSDLYMSLSGELAAVLCIDDPVRTEARDVIEDLHHAGFDKVVMMTGDSLRTAKAVAALVGVDEVHGEVLPEDKAEFIRAEHEAGRKVVMVGDGINDSPALSESDAGVAIASGAAIAREVADITVSAGDLHEIVMLRKIADAMMQRINSNYRFIMGFNSALIALGLFGVLPPTTTATLHNASTLLIGVHSSTNLIKT